MLIARNRYDSDTCGKNDGDGEENTPRHRENLMAVTSPKLEPGQAELGQTELTVVHESSYMNRTAVNTRVRGTKFSTRVRGTKFS